MLRSFWRAILLLVAWSATATAEDGISQLFPKRVHDFGTVARAARAEYEFRFTNTTGKTLHVAGVRASCGCTTPKVLKATVPPNESGSILAVLNTRTHLGQRAATITVTFDRPQYREAQLQIRAYVRQDLVIHPGEIQFGNIDLGKGAEQVVDINFAGRDDWKILRIEQASSTLQTDLQEKKRGGGLVSYQLRVRLDERAPAGYLGQQLILVTNDRRSHAQRIPLVVDGRVSAPISISPASLYLGELEPGQKVTKQFALRGKQPFRVLEVTAESGDANLQFKIDEKSSSVHLVEVTFTAGQPGELRQALRITTDMRGHEVLHSTVLGTVRDVPKLQ